MGLSPPRAGRAETTYQSGEGRYRSASKDSRDAGEARPPSKQAQRESPPRRHQISNQTTPKKTLQQWGHLQWKGRWEKAALEGGSATVWSTPWKQSPRKLYAGLTKAESTALFLLRTEVLGLNAWLAAIHKPDIYPQCPCGWIAQTVRHILLHCPRYDRTQLLTNCGTERNRRYSIAP